MVLVLALLIAWQDKPTEKCSVSGTAIDAVTGETLSKVDVRLEPLDRKATHVAVTKSDAKGQFELVDLEAGSYHLLGERNGYLAKTYSSLMRLEAGQALGGLQFKLTPSALISGTVRDSDGEPLENAHVVLAKFTYKYGRGRVEGYDSTDTDDRGEYRFRGLAAGKYYVGVDAKASGWNLVDHSAGRGPAEISVPTLYPGVTDMGAAAAVEVAAGKRIMGIDVTLVKTRVYRVSGRVTNAPGGERPVVVMSDAKNGGMRDHVLRTTTKDAAGNFELRGVPPGLYVLTTGAANLRGRTTVAVGAADVEDIRVTLSAGAEVKLHVITEGAKQLDPNELGLRYYLTADGRSGFSPSDAENATMYNVPPDHYELQLDGVPHGYYVKSVRTSDADVLADGLTVAGPGTLTVAITLASDGGAVQGLVRDKNQQPVAGATILLAPDVRWRADLFRNVASDQNGHYEFPAIAPGGYKLFALQDAESDPWMNPDFLKDYEKQGEKLTVDANGHASTDLHVATAPDPR